MRTVLHRLYFGFTPCDVRRELLLARARLAFVDLSCLERVDLMCLHLFVFGMLCFFFLFFFCVWDKLARWNWTLERNIKMAQPINRERYGDLIDRLFPVLFLFSRRMERATWQGRYVINCQSQTRSRGGLLERRE